MSKLKTLKNASKLRRLLITRDQTDLSPVKKNETRWSSTYCLLHRYIELFDYLHQPNLWDNEVLELIPTPVEHNLVSHNLLPKLEHIQRVSLILQKSENVDLSIARTLIDKLIENLPETAHRLSKNAEIVHNKTFENAIVKLQSNKEDELSVLERSAVNFLRKNIPNDEEINLETEEIEELDEYSQALKANEANKRQRVERNESAYLPCPHIIPTSNICERLFSNAKAIMTDYRKHMSPFHLEMLLYIKINHRFWREYTIQEIYTEISNSNSAARRNRNDTQMLFQTPL